MPSRGEDLEGYINVPTAQAQSYVNAHAGYKLRSTGDGLATVYKPLAGVVFELYETNNGVKVGSAIPSMEIPILSAMPVES